MKIKQITNQEFNNFTSNFSQKSIYQTPEYGFIMNNHGFDSILVGLEKDSVIIAVSLILIKKTGAFKYAYAPRGFLIDYNNHVLFKEFTVLLKQFLNKMGIVAVKVNPLITKKICDFKTQIKHENPNYDNLFNLLKECNYYHLGYNNFFEALKPRFEAFIDISLPEQLLFSNISKNYQTKIKSAIKNGVKVIQGNMNEINILHNFTKEKYNRDITYFQDCYGYFAKHNMIDYLMTKLDTTHYLRVVQNRLHEYELLSSKLNEKILKSKIKKEKLIKKKINIDKYLNQYHNELIFATNLLKNNPDGIITSAALIVRNGEEATILIDGYDKSLGRLNSKHLLIWQLIQTYKKLGYTKLNLGGMSNIMVDSTKYTGLANFKLGFNAKMVEYAGDFELIINKASYSLYRNFKPLKNLLKKETK